MVAIFVRRSCLRAVLLVSLVVPAIAAAVDAPAPEKPMPAKTATAPFAMPAAVMEVVAGQEEASRIGAVGAQADAAGVVDVAAVDPDIFALSQPQPVAPSGDFDPA